MTTDTPRTDAVQFQPRPISPTIESEMLRALSRKLERELNEAKDELEEIKETYAFIVQQSHFDEREVHCSCVPALRAEVERLKKIKPIKLFIKSYSYECGDGCCQEWGETWLVDGEEVTSGPCEHNRMQQLLSHLGFDASIEGLDEDGEESWSL
jgi:hypothetical protein